MQIKENNCRDEIEPNSIDISYISNRSNMISKMINNKDETFIYKLQNKAYNFQLTEPLFIDYLELQSSDENIKYITLEVCDNFADEKITIPIENNKSISNISFKINRAIKSFKILPSTLTRIQLNSIKLFGYPVSKPDNFCIKVHKGTDEIGGSCIELSTSDTTILLDYGTPLRNDSKQIALDKKIDAILISHPHQDHFGEIVNIDTSTPVYCGELSLNLMNATKIFTGNEILKNNFQTFQAWQEFEIGDFKIKPYLVDHSATDAYSFLIEANGKRVLYSGDFRANGRKSKLFDKMIEDDDLKEVDILLMEGTMLQRSNKDFPDEQSVEEKIYQTIKENNQISFMIGSSQNIDSIVSAYRACKRADKTFVIDMYTSWILERLQAVSGSIPNISWNDVKVLRSYGKYYYDKISENPSHFGNFKSKIYEDGNHIQLEEIKLNPNKYFLKVSPSIIEKSIQKLEVENANIIYSQWLGYMNEEFSDTKTVEMYKMLENKYKWVYAHTSGHADLPALQKFASAIKPKKLIPIHTEYKSKFPDYFDNVMILEDDESFDIVSDSLTTYQANEMNELFKNDLQEYQEDEAIEEWIGIDFDGTLAFYDEWRGVEHIGEPIKPMLEFVKDLVSQNKKIKIFTARATNAEAIPYIKTWLKENNLPEFEITNTKDFGMTMLYDDRCTRVVTNSGIIIQNEIGE